MSDQTDRKAAAQRFANFMRPLHETADTKPISPEEAQKLAGRLRDLASEIEQGAQLVTSWSMVPGTWSDSDGLHIDQEYTGRRELNIVTWPGPTGPSEP